MNLTTYNIIYLISNFFTIFIIKQFANAFVQPKNKHKFLTPCAYTVFVK